MLNTLLPEVRCENFPTISQVYCSEPASVVDSGERTIISSAV